MKRCPRCRKLNQSDSWLCDCGFEFAGNEPEAEPTPEEQPTSAEIQSSRSRARRACKYGIIGWLPWLSLFFLPSGGGSGNLADGFLTLFLFGWSFIWFGAGSVIAYSRDRTAYAAARDLWAIALLLNYGFFVWLVLFTFFLGTVRGGPAPLDGP